MLKIAIEDYTKNQCHIQACNGEVELVRRDIYKGNVLRCKRCNSEFMVVTEPFFTEGEVEELEEMYNQSKSQLLKRIIDWFRCDLVVQFKE